MPDTHWLIKYLVLKTIEVSITAGGNCPCEITSVHLCWLTENFQSCLNGTPLESVPPNNHKRVSVLSSLEGEAAIEKAEIAGGVEVTSSVPLLKQVQVAEKPTENNEKWW